MYLHGSTPIGGSAYSSRGILAGAVAVLAAGAAAAFLCSVPGAPMDAPVMETCSISMQAPAANPASAADIVQLCQEGRLQEALDMANGMIARGEDTGNAGTTEDIHYLRGGVLLLMGRENDARPDLAMAAGTVPGGPGVDDYNMHDALALSGDSEAVLKMDQEALRTGPSSPYTTNNLAFDFCLYASKSEAATARSAMAQVPSSLDDSHLCDTRAWAEYVNGNPEGAARLERRAIQMATDSGDEDMRFYCAALEGFEGNTRQAAADMREVFRNNIEDLQSWAAMKRFQAAQEAR